MFHLHGPYPSREAATFDAKKVSSGIDVQYYPSQPHFGIGYRCVGYRSPGWYWVTG